MTNPSKVLVIMIFVESRLANGAVISLERNARKAEGTTHACRLVHPVNVGHLKPPVFLSKINDDGGFFAAEMLGRAEGTAVPTMRLQMRDTM